MMFFSRIYGLISTARGTKHPWEKGIQVCLNKGPCHFLREIMKIRRKNIDKILKSSPVSLGQYQPKLAQLG